MTVGVEKITLIHPCLGAVHKKRPQKINSPGPQNVRTGSTPLSPCPCGHNINFEKSEVFLHQKCRRPRLKNLLSPLSAKCPHWTNLSILTADVFYGRPLIPYAFIVYIS